MSKKTDALATLRRKFVAVTMVLITVVMVIAFTAIAANYRYSDTEHVNNALIGTIGQAMHHQTETRVSTLSMSVDASVAEAPDEQRWHMAPKIGYDDAGKREIKPIPIVVYSYDGVQTLVDTETSTAMIDEGTAYEAVNLIVTYDDGYGSIETLDLDYCKLTVEDGTTWVAMTDSSYSQDWISKVQGLGVGSAFLWVALLVMTILLSRWIIRPVERTWEGQKRFIADASHDLQAPLTVILANMSILAQSPDATIREEMQWVENTQKEATSMKGLVSELLELSRLEGGGDAAVAGCDEIVDIGEIVDGECLAFDAVALENGYIFDCAVEDELIVKGNSEQLSKMIRTLLENAFKYSDKRISVSAQRIGKNVEIAISNDGAQIAQEDIPHVFDRFYRADRARTPGGGHGLGLAIAKQVAVNHGGDIVCRSSAGNTVFTVKLPLMKQD